jgi:hypothetical protein
MGHLTNPFFMKYIDINADTKLLGLASIYTRLYLTLKPCLHVPSLHILQVAQCKPILQENHQEMLI